MIYDKTNKKVLVQDGIKYWKGVSFSGRHVEDGYNIVKSIIIQVKEETI